LELSTGNDGGCHCSTEEDPSNIRKKEERYYSKWCELERA
jgi:hypothetical protein